MPGNKRCWISTAQKMYSNNRNNSHRAWVGSGIDARGNHMLQYLGMYSTVQDLRASLAFPSLWSLHSNVPMHREHRLPHASEFRYFRVMSLLALGACALKLLT